MMNNALISQLGQLNQILDSKGSSLEWNVEGNTQSTSYREPEHGYYSAGGDVHKVFNTLDEISITYHPDGSPNTLTYLDRGPRAFSIGGTTVKNETLEVDFDNQVVTYFNIAGNTRVSFNVINEEAPGNPVGELISEILEHRQN